MYEIYAYGNNESLFGIFNAIAAIMGSQSYIQALAIVAFCGFVTALFAYAFAPHKLIGWQWLASVVLVYSILFVPKVTVGIVDKLGTQPVQVVSNVPFGLAFFGNLTSSVGNTLTETFEAAFQTLPGPAQQPADLAYQKHGVMFGNTLIKRTRQIVFNDPNFRTDLINFIHNCTMYDLSDGALDPAVFARAPVGAGDLWSLMANPNPARFSVVTTATTTDTRPCPAVYANLNARMPAVINLTTEKLAALLNPDLPIAQAVLDFSNQASQAYVRTRLGQAGVDAAAIVRQNGLINAINDTSEIIGQKINDPASVILGVGRAQATAQTNAAWINFGKMAEDALPLIRNTIEAIIYALFPFVVLLLFVTYGQTTMKSVQSYVVTLVWIQLWPPIYAILNYMASIASAKHIAAAAQLGGATQGLAIVSASPVYANAISDQAVVGYLVLAIPSIAWAAIKGMQTVAQAALLGLSSIQGATSSAAAMAGTGNLSMGNVGMDQVNLSPSTSSAYMSSYRDIWGTASQGITASGAVEAVRMQQSISSLTTMPQFSEKEASAMATAARESEMAANSKRELSMASTAAAIAHAVSLDKQFSDTAARGGASIAGLSGRSSREISTIGQIADDIQQRYGGEANVDAGKKLTFGAAAGLSWKAISLGLDFQGSAAEQERLHEGYVQAKSALERSGISVGTGIAENFSKTDAYEWARRSNTTGAEKFDSSLRTAQEHQTSAEKLHTTSIEQSRLSQFMHEYASGTSTNASNYLYQKLHESGRWEDFKRADPLTQHRMALDIGKNYVAGGYGTDGQYVGNEGWPPSHNNHVPGRTPEQMFRDTNLAGEAAVRAANDSFNAQVTGQQQRGGVLPNQRPVDTVSPQVESAKRAVLDRQDTEVNRITGESAARKEAHQAAMDEKAGKTVFRAAGAVSNDAERTIRNATGQTPK